MTNNLLRLGLLILVQFISAQAMASGAGLTYQGRLVGPDGNPVNAANVQFRLQIRTPGSENCLLYEELQSKDMSSSNGVFAISINDGSGVRQDTNTYTIEQIFANRGTLTFPGGYCISGGNYSPNTTDGRKLQVYFNDGSFSGWEPVPSQAINFIPMAIESMQVGGYKRDQLVKVASGVDTTGFDLSAANFTELMALVTGTSTQFVKPSSATFTAAPQWSGTPSGANDLANKSYVDAQVAAGLPNFGTAGTYTKVTTDAKGRVSSGTTLAASDIPALDAAKITSGVLPIANGGTNSSTALVGSKVMVSNATAIVEGMASNTAKSNNTFVMRDGTGSFAAALGTFDGLSVLAGGNLALNGATSGSISMQAPTSPTSYTLTLPPTAGTIGQVLTTDGSGITSWATGGSGLPAAAGTAAAPGYAFSGNTNTGMFGAATNQIGFSTNGSERLRVDASGNVGIGNSSPSFKLDVSGVARFSNIEIGSGGDQINNSNGTMFFNFSNTQNISMVQGGGRVGIGTTSPTAALHVVGANGSGGSAPTALTVIGGIGAASFPGGSIGMTSGDGNGAGNAGGINLTGGAAGAGASVAGGINLSGGASAGAGWGGSINILAGKAIAGGNSGTVTIRSGHYDNTVVPTGGAYLSLGSSGSVTSASATLSSGDAHSSNPGSTGSLTLKTSNALAGGSGGNISITAGNGDTGALGGTINISAGNGGSSNMNGSNVSIIGGAKGGSGTDGNVILASTRGKVGIATASPGSTLDVKGTLRLSGATSGYVGFAPASAAGSTTYTLPSADGTTGQVLTTNGGGTLSWATSSGGGTVSGTTGAIAKFTSGTAVGDSVMTESGGNIGIGTASPGNKLSVAGDSDLVGNIGVGTTANGGVARIYVAAGTNGSGTYNMMTLKHNGSSINDNVSIGFSPAGMNPAQIIGVAPGGNNVDLRFNVVNSTVNSTAMTILGTGNVGIGTTSPSQKLEIVESGGGDSSILIRSTANSASLMLQGFSTSYKWLLGNSNAGHFGLQEYGWGAQEYIHAEPGLTSATVPLFIKSNGSVGIGNSSPTEKLETAGNIKASGQIYAGVNLMATGATVDFNLGNTAILQSVGGSAITLNNMKDGASYVVIVQDTTVRTYTFTNCTNTRFSPANAATISGSETVYNIIKTTIASATYCYISWSSGYQ